MSRPALRGATAHTRAASRTSRPLCGHGLVYRDLSPRAPDIALRQYDVDPGLEGETVTLWFGLYDDQLYVENGKHRYGPYMPSSGPIPLHHDPSLLQPGHLRQMCDDHGEILCPSPCVRRCCVELLGGTRER
jgi:hypothetical protein